MADDLPPFVVPNVTKIRGLNLPGAPWANSVCCGMIFTYSNKHKIFAAETSVKNNNLEET